MREESLEQYGGVLAAPPRRRLRNVLSVAGAVHAVVILVVVFVVTHHDGVTCRTLVSPDNTQQAWAVAFSPHGQVLMTYGGDGSAYLQDAATGRRIAAVSEPVTTSDTGPPAVSPDGGRLALVDVGLATSMWNLTTGQQIGTMTDPGIGTQADPINSGADSVAFSPDGRTLAVGDSWGNAYLWDVTTRQLIATLANPSTPGGGTSVAFAPDGRVLAADDANGRIYLWDAATEQLITSLTGPGSGAGAAAFSPDGRTLAAGAAGPAGPTGADRAGAADGGAVYVWNTATWHRIAALPAGQGVRSVAFSPNGRTLAVGTSDSSIDLWNTATWQHAATLTDTRSPGINSLAFSPDNRTLASTDDGGNAYLCPVR